MPSDADLSQKSCCQWLSNDSLERLRNPCSPVLNVTRVGKDELSTFDSFFGYQTLDKFTSFITQYKGVMSISLVCFVGVIVYFTINIPILVILHRVSFACWEI